MRPDEDGVSSPDRAQDVLVPWVQTTSGPKVFGDGAQTSKTFQRYYHLFTASELPELFRRALAELGLVVGLPDSAGDHNSSHGAEIIQTGWERSNYYLEARMWQRSIS